MTGNKHSNWRGRILEKQKTFGKTLRQLNRIRERKLQNENVISNIERRINVKQKGTETIYEEVRQSLVAVGAKLE